MYDVIVVGGGISGTMAAVAAARLGAKTLIVEQYGFLGGMMTASGVGPMMTFHAGEKQVIQGIPGELIERLVAKGYSPGHILDTTRYTYTVTPFDVEGMKRELELMVTEAGGEILYHTMLAGVEPENGRVKHIQICNKAGLSNLEAKVYVDATGDADLAYRAGVPCTKGRSSDGAAQPMTMKMRLFNVDINKTKKYIHEHIEEFPRLKGDTSIIENSPRLSIGGFVKTFAEARGIGEISFQREDLLFFEGNTPGEIIVNTSRVTGHDSTEPLSLSHGEMEGRRQTDELFRFLKKRVPGFENAWLAYTGPMIGVRSSRQIVGLYTLEADDVLTCKKFEDVIAHSGYPIDIHSPDGNDTLSRHLPWGAIYSIPYRCLINNAADNLLTVGRCVSATFEAQAAIRLTPSMGAVGQAGGVGAAFAAKTGKSVKDFVISDIQETLVKQGAYLEI